MNETGHQEHLQRQVAAELEKFVAWQLHIQGQVNALRVALSACLSFAAVNPELRGHVERHLTARLQVMKEKGAAVGEVVGFESALRELLPDSGQRSGNQTAH